MRPIVRRVLLALADLAALLTFGLIGMASHEEGLSVTVFARAVLPFVVAWFLLAPLLGAYRPPWTAARVALIWLACGVIALAARSAVFDRTLFNAFFVVALAGNGMFLLAARALYRLADKRTGPGARAPAPAKP